MIKTSMRLSVLAVLAGCATMPETGSRPEPTPLPAEVEAPGDLLEATPVSVLDPQQGSDEGFSKGDGFFYTIGEGVVSLGDPRRAGLWVQAPFVEDGTTVELHSTQTGLSVLAEASQSDGFMQMSLGAFQALELSPTGLPVIEVRTP